MLKWFLLAAVAFLMVFVLYHWIKFNNPYKLYMIFGKKGSGKSTLLTKLAINYIRKGWTVYSTEPVPGAYQFDPKKVGELMFDPHSIVLVDEVGMIWDNRNFKSFLSSTRDWFKLQRHYKCRVYLFSQAFDIDKKLRDLTDYMYLVRCHFNCWSVARRIDKGYSFTDPSQGDGDSRLVETLQFSHWLTIPFGGAIFTWIPAWSKFFDSHFAPVLPLREFTLIEKTEDIYYVGLFHRWLLAVKRFVRKFSPVAAPLSVREIMDDVSDEDEEQLSALPFSDVDADAGSDDERSDAIL